VSKDAGPGAWEAPRAGGGIASSDDVPNSTAPQHAPASLLIPRRQILTSEDHATTLHSGGRGKVTFAQRDNNGRWKQQPILLADLAYFARSLAGKSDIYISQNRFHGWRRTVSNLAQLNACFCDLDYYHAPDIAHLRPDLVLQLVYERLDEHLIPQPTVAIGTGRGIALLWLLESPIPRDALPRWAACQRTIYEALIDLGADRYAIDAARVLRLVGTENSKSNAFVMPLTDVGPPWPFDALADEILPRKREELERIRTERAKVKQRRRAEVWPLARFTPWTLAQGRLIDLQALLDHRWWGSLRPGHRDGWMFVAAVNVAYLVPSSCLPRELADLARRVATWSEGETRSRMSAVLDRSRRAYLGEQIPFNGKLRDPRYRLKTSTIVELLGITEEEMIAAGLRCLVTEDMRLELRRARSERRRRKAGAIDRASYLANSLSNTRPWEAEDISRRTWERHRKAQNASSTGRDASPTRCMAWRSPSWGRERVPDTGVSGSEPAIRIVKPLVFATPPGNQGD
jgi:hypothetical protein